MITNLYIVRHGKMNMDERNKQDYLHLSPEGIAFGLFLDNYFKNTYFDHVFYQVADAGMEGSYNCCRNTTRGLKGVKEKFDKTHVSRVFQELNSGESDAQNIMLCFRADGFNMISNIINPKSEEQFSKDYHRVFHYKFYSNSYSFVSKFSAEENVLS